MVTEWNGDCVSKLSCSGGKKLNLNNYFYTFIKSERSVIFARIAIKRSFKLMSLALHESFCPRGNPELCL